MTYTKRVLAAVALAGAALSIAGTAHAGNANGAGDSGGSVLDQSNNFALDAHGDSVFSGMGNTLSELTGSSPLLLTNQAAGQVGSSENVIGNPVN